MVWTPSASAVPVLLVILLHWPQWASEALENTIRDHTHGHNLAPSKSEFSNLETPDLPKNEKNWHQLLTLKAALIPPSPAMPFGPPALRQRALHEQGFGWLKLEAYLARNADARMNSNLLDEARERMRKSIALSEQFVALRPIAAETLIMHVLAEAVYAIDARHMQTGKRRVYTAHELFNDLDPVNEALMRLDPSIATDTGDSCLRTTDCGQGSECVGSLCQPPQFATSCREFLGHLLAKLQHRVMEHIWDVGMDQVDSAARMWGGNGTSSNSSDSGALRVSLNLHAGSADPLLTQDERVIQSMVAFAIGGNTTGQNIRALSAQRNGTVVFEVYGAEAIRAANSSARIGGLAGLGEASMEAFDSDDISLQRPKLAPCTGLGIMSTCCQGRDSRHDLVNGVDVLDSPCAIVMRHHGQWQCQPLDWVEQHLQRVLGEEVVIVGCNATHDLHHITKHVGHPRRQLAEEIHSDMHRKVRYRFAHNWAISDDRGGRVPVWDRFDSRHVAADHCDAQPTCTGYTCNIGGFKTHPGDDDHVLWCELRHGATQGFSQHGHVSYFKRESHAMPGHEHNQDFATDVNGDLDDA
jgi:hypothetical protein